MLLQLLGGPDASIAFRRQQSALFAESQPPPPPGVRVSAATVGGVPVERLDLADGAPVGTLLHLHGGGYVMGDPAGSRGFTASLALAAGASIVSVDYRLAPRHPFPAAVDDALAVYAGLLAAGTPAPTIAIGGESAGGGLAMATLLAARDAGLPMPSSAFALSPWTDLACEGESFAALHGRDPLLTRAILLEMAQAYLGAADPGHPRASPSLADMRGFPSLLVQVGSEEVLLSDARALAGRARSCGVEVILEEWPEMIHVWQMFGGALPEADQAVDRIARFLKRHWAAA